MIPSRRLRLPALFVACLLALPVHAQAVEREDIPAEADMLLWCASALHLLGIATQEQDEARTYFAASDSLVEKAANVLMAAEIPAGDLEGIVGDYDERVVADFESGAELPYAPETCIDALELG